jgi:hypothetical protein
VGKCTSGCMNEENEEADTSNAYLLDEQTM